MVIKQSIDIEDAIRSILITAGLTAYCRPLPANFSTPSLLITATGGTVEESWSNEGKIDSFTVVIDSRADTEANALALLRSAIGILKASVATQTTSVRTVTVNTQYSWGLDPVRPDLAMCSANLTVRAHTEKITIS